MAGSGFAAWTILFAMSACTFDRSGNGGTNPDGGTQDASPPDAARRRPTHLLLSEVTTGPPTAEFVEIFNPTCEDVPLDFYYLTDDPSYPLLPSWSEAPPNPGNLDAIIRFPAGVGVPSGQIIVVARDGAAFATSYGRSPDFAITNVGSAQPMVIVAHGSSADMELANSGEPIALFFWDGTDDLIRDVDTVIAGEAPASTSQLIAKQDLAPAGVEGPDPDEVASLYAPELASLPTMQARDAVGGSYQRIVFEDVFEVAEGGNGVGGHDETSEDTRTTWEQDVGTPPTPGEVGASLGIDCDGSSS